MNYDMKYSPLGNTGLQVSRISFGCAGLGNIYTPVSAEEGAACVRRAYEEYGINYFDTASGYGINGSSESVLGLALKDKAFRKKVIVATKCGDYNEPDFEQDYSYEGIIRRFDNQLQRLQTDYVDILQAHDVDWAKSLDYVLEETIPALEKLKKDGKVRFIGATSIRNASLKYLAERTDSLDMILTFGRYNLIDTTLVGYFDELRRSKGIGMLNCSVLFMGFLTKRTLAGGYSTNEWYKDDPQFADTMELLRKADALCDAHGVDIGELAVQFGCDCDFCDSTLISMARTERLKQNMELLQKPYDRELAMQVHEILKNCNLTPKES